MVETSAPHAWRQRTDSVLQGHGDRKAATTAAEAFPGTGNSSLTALNGTIYFGFGSNLWMEQMAGRCPDSEYLGIARLPGYRWMINARGYANIVQVEASSNEQEIQENKPIQEHASDVVWGLVYRLSPDDEAKLDVNEGVPHAYTKEHLLTQFWPTNNPCKAPFQGAGDCKIDTSKPGEKQLMLVYIDRKRTNDDKPKREYIIRMNSGIRDALSVGLPESYIQTVMRKFIREPGTEDYEDEELRQLAAKQALRFEDAI